MRIACICCKRFNKVDDTGVVSLRTSLDKKNQVLPLPIQGQTYDNEKGEKVNKNDQSMNQNDISMMSRQGNGLIEDENKNRLNQLINFMNNNISCPQDMNNSDSHNTPSKTNGNIINKLSEKKSVHESPEKNKQALSNLKNFDEKNKVSAAYYEPKQSNSNLWMKNSGLKHKKVSKNRDSQDITESKSELNMEQERKSNDTVDGIPTTNYNERLMQNNLSVSHLVNKSNNICMDNSNEVVESNEVISTNIQTENKAGSTLTKGDSQLDNLVETTVNDLK